MSLDHTLVLIGIGSLLLFAGFAFALTQAMKYLQACSIYNVLKHFETSKEPLPERTIPCRSFDFYNTPPGTFHDVSDNTDYLSVRLAENSKELLIIPPFSEGKILPWTAIALYKKNSLDSRKVDFKVAPLGTDIRLFISVDKVDFEESHYLKRHTLEKGDPDQTPTRNPNLIPANKIFLVILGIGLALSLGVIGMSL